MIPETVVPSPMVRQRQQGESINSQLSTLNSQLSPLRLFSHFFELRAEHIYTSADKIAAESDVKPVSLLAFDSEFVRLGNAARSGRISSGLCDDIYQQIPSARLSRLRKRARDRL